jgi:hypothetical protein
MISLCTAWNYSVIITAFILPEYKSLLDNTIKEVFVMNITTTLITQVNRMPVMR